MAADSRKKLRGCQWFSYIEGFARACEVNHCPMFFFLFQGVNVRNSNNKSTIN